MTLSDRISIYLGAQRELYSYVGIDPTQLTTANRYLPAPYPPILDFRGLPWSLVQNRAEGDDEIHVREVSGGREPVPGQQPLRFNILSIQRPSIGEPTSRPNVVAHCSYLPTPLELSHDPAAAESAQLGANVYGDEFLLLLTAAQGSSSNPGFDYVLR
jgi:hypothetical protein